MRSKTSFSERLFPLLFFLYLIFSFLPFFPVFLTYGVVALIFIDCSLMTIQKNGTIRINNTAYFKWIMIWIAIASISVLWSLRAKLALWAIVQCLLILIVCSSIIVYAKTQDRLKTVIKTYYIAAVILLFTVLAFVDLHDLEGNRLTDSMDGDMEEWNSNYIALPLTVAIYMGYLVLWKNGGLFKRLLYVSLSAGMIIVVFLSGSRSALISMMIPVMVIAFAKNRHFIKPLILSVFALAVVYLLIMNVPLLYSNIGIRVEELFMVLEDGEEAGDASRLLLAMSGLDWFTSKPILGYGLNNFRVLSDNLLYFGRNFYAHNNYVELLVDVGLVGFLVYYSAYFYLLKCRKKIAKPALPWYLAITVFLLFADMTNVSYYEFTIQIVLCLAFCILNVYSNNNKYEIR